MSGHLAPLNPTELDFDTIRLAVMETERGRWFLDEYARRNRHADTDGILVAMQRIEGAIIQQRETSEMDKFRLDVLEMSRAIARTRDEIAAIKPADGTGGRLTEATDELDSIVAATETATSDILAAAEKVQEAAWTLRENGAQVETCEALDQLATGIYTSCSFQDLTSQRIRRVMATIEFLEKRVNAMADIWLSGDEDKAAHTPEVDPNAGIVTDPSMSQADVDFVLVNTVPQQVAVEPELETATSDFELDMAFPTGQPLGIAALPAIDLQSVAEPHPDSQPVPEPAAEIDEMLFVPDHAAVPASAAQMPESVEIETALAKIRSGSELSFAEAAKALDQLKSMSPEDRSHLFKG